MLERLFSPLALGPIEIRNRVVSTSHQTSLVHDHLPTDDLIAYHRARAAGGAGLIVVEATAVHPTGLLTAHTVGGYLPEIVPVWRADERRRQGARHPAHMPALPRRPRDDRLRHAASGGRPELDPLGAVQDRAQGADASRDRRDARGLPAGGGLRGRGRPRRRRGVRRLRLPADAVPVAPRERPHRRVRRELREPVPVPARGARGDARRVRPGRHDRLPPDRRAHLGRRHGLSTTSSRRPKPSGDDGLADYVSVTLGSSPTYRGSTWIVPPSPAARNADRRSSRGP